MLHWHLFEFQLLFQVDLQKKKTKNLAEFIILDIHTYINIYSKCLANLKTNILHTYVLHIFKLSTLMLRMNL